MLEPPRYGKSNDCLQSLCWAKTNIKAHPCIKWCYVGYMYLLHWVANIMLSVCAIGHMHREKHLRKFSWKLYNLFYKSKELIWTKFFLVCFLRYDIATSVFSFSVMMEKYLYLILFVRLMLILSRLSSIEDCIMVLSCLWYALNV